MLIFLLGLIFSCTTLKSQDTGAVLSSQVTQIKIMEGKIIRNECVEIKINDRSGENFTRISIPYSKMRKVSKLDAFIKDAAGNIVRKLIKKDIIDKSLVSEESFYEDEMVKEFTLKYNVYPYTIVYIYQVQEDEFYQIANWIPVLRRNIPTLKAVLSVDVPKDYRIWYRTHIIDSSWTEKTETGTRYSWVTSYSGHTEPESFSPPVIQFLPRVIIVPEKFNYNCSGSFESWTLFGDWVNDLMQGLNVMPPEEATHIRNLINGTSEIMQKIRIIYNYLQDNTRYVNVTIETGGLKPYPASYVAENKYGDCKALSNFLKSALDVAGIRSYVVLINAGDPTVTIDKEFPYQQFNHMIICIPSGNDTIWLDGTSDNPFGYQGTFTQGRDAFFIDKGRSCLVRTPALRTKDVLVSRNVQFEKGIDNKTIAHFKCSYHGRMFEDLLYLTHLVDIGSRKKIYADNYVENGYDLLELNLEGPVRDSSVIHVLYSADASRHYNSYGKDLIIDILPFTVPEPEALEKRKLQLQIDYPIFRSDTLSYLIPSEYVIAKIPANQTIDSEFGRFEITSRAKDGKVEIFKKFLLYREMSTHGIYPDYFKFITSVKTAEMNNKIIANRKY